MDPVTLIVAALAAGAAAAAGDAAKDAGKSAVASLYGKLKAAITGKSPDEAAAGKTLDRHAGNPDSYNVPVTDVVVEASADQDQVILDLAKRLLETNDPAGAQIGRYNVIATSVQGAQFGDNNTQTNNFAPVFHGTVSAGGDINAGQTVNVDNRPSPRTSGSATDATNP